MIRFLRLLLLALVAIVLIALAVANRDAVELHLLPPDMGDFLGLSWAVRLPLFLVIFGGILVGLALGFVWEWRRAHRGRVAARATHRRAAHLEREVQRLKQPEGPKDEVLALLEKPGR